MRAQRAITRGLNRNRQPILKAVFKGAATTVLTKEDHPLRKILRQAIERGDKAKSGEAHTGTQTRHACVDAVEARGGIRPDQEPPEPIQHA